MKRRYENVANLSLNAVIDDYQPRAFH